MLDFKERLEKYCRIPAVSGFEDLMISEFANDIENFVDEISFDVLGNVITMIKGEKPDAPTVMIFAHLDSVGMIVKKIEKTGFLRIEKIGGIPEKVLAGTKVIVRSKGDNYIHGVIGTTSHHLTREGEKYIVPLIESLHIDVGANTEAQILAMGIQVGSPVVYEPNFLELENDLVSGTFIDNRAGCSLLVSIAEYFSKNRLKYNLAIVGSVQEEFNLRGASVVAYNLRPMAAICLDLVATVDTPEVKISNGVKIGSGPVLGKYTFHGRGTLNGLIPHPALVALIEKTALELDIGIQHHTTLGQLTDASYVQLVGSGIPCVDLGWGTRYTHSPVELCSLVDLLNLNKLLIRALESFPFDMSFNRVPDGRLR